MSSEKRILANRANGAKSRGPKTLEGKALRREEARLHLMYQRSLSNLVFLRNSKFRVEPNKSLTCNISSENQEPTEPTEPKPGSDPEALAA